MRDIILIALEEEAPRMASWVNVFFTGVGKVNAGITAGKLIERYDPETVFNFGTAGGVSVSNGIHEIKNFVQRDIMCTELGFETGQTPFEDGVVLLNGDIADMCCSTGDNFVSDYTNEQLIADVVDMEAYAIAKACKQSFVNFKCFKYISDSADENAKDDWKTTVADGQVHYIKIYQDYIKKLKEDRNEQAN
jgi:adenosylhomocysteine nucleosidase|tara:strand:- start:2713 stop:3288 length:576 start_codon:yes stop_codon:yes gene_type:complete